VSAILSGALEHELKGLTDEIASVSRDAQAKKEAADAKVAEYRAAGVNPLVDDEAAKVVEAMYLDADNDKTRLSVLNARRAQALSKFASSVPAPSAQKGNSGSLIERLIAGTGLTREQLAGMGEIGLSGSLPAVEMTDRDSLKYLLGNRGGIFAVGGDGASLIPIDQRLYPPVELPVRRLRLIDLISVGGTDSDLVRYGKQTVRTDVAAIKAVGTAGVGVAYDQATYTWTTADVSVRSIGQYAKAPRENLADIAALQTLIEGQLSAGVLLEAERQIALGDGTGINFTGIYPAALAGGYTIDSDNTNDRRIGTIHKAITAVRLSLFDEPDAIVMHPSDYETMLLQESTSGGFLLSNLALAQEQPTIFGLPVVVTPLATQHSPLVGNFKQGATLWVRAGASVRISDSNEDDFIKRMITVLAEFRAAFAVQRAFAFCSVTTF
jgi:HK97 family phage major capsid protein